MARGSRTVRPWVPEVVQTSGMDCGPACLKALLEGHGVVTDYGRIREACRTTVDGTSIDTLEDLAVEYGLDAEQVMVPLEHLLIPEANLLPAIVVVQRADGFTHFVVLWRRHPGGWLQVMDPAQGRRWISERAFLDEIYRHRLRISAQDWAEWARSEEFLRPLASRLERLGASESERADFRKAVEACPDGSTAATWDAALRMVEDVRSSGSLRGGEARSLLTGLVEAAKSGAREVVPEAFWSIRPGGEELVYRGAVAIRTRGRASAGEPDRQASVVRETAKPAPLPRSQARRVWELLGQRGAMLRLGAAVVLATTMIFSEAILFRGLLDLESYLAPGGDRWVTLLLVLLFVAFNRAVAFLTELDLKRWGRRLEMTLRMRWSEKLGRIDPSYFRSRPVSDTAERAHRLHGLRDVPASASRMLRAGIEVGLAACGMVWIYPSQAVLVLSAVLLAILLPFATQPWLAEHDLNVRTQNGALSRFVLEALQGLQALGSRAVACLRYEQDRLLASWGRARYRYAALHELTEGLQIALVLGCVIYVVWSYVAEGRHPAGVLLLAYWGVTLPFRGREVIYAHMEWTGQRSLLLRVDELLQGPEVEARGGEVLAASEREGTGEVAALSLDLQGVEVVASGIPILQGLELEVAAGSHVAIVGPSGAGKSSLFRLLLGLYEAHQGSLSVGGRGVEAGDLAEIRSRIAWVDPSIQLWNRTLLENLEYGAPAGEESSWQDVVTVADLQEVLRDLPEGLQSPVGDSGSRLSGGEGQRLRFARATARRDAALVLLDEPFRGLDPPRRAELLRRARELWSSATLLYVTHEISEASSFDRVLVLEGGRVVEDGSPESLAADPGSSFASLLEAETALEEALHRAPSWQRWRMENGDLRVPGAQGSAS